MINIEAVCIDNEDGDCPLTIGEIYIILKCAYKYHYLIVDDNGEAKYYSTARFEVL